MGLTKEQRIAFNKASALCSKSEKCTSEIHDKLKLWGLNEVDSLAIIDELKKEKYVDDERFARAYVKDKLRFNHWGKQKIEYMLRTKKISPDILERAFEEIIDDDYFEDLRKLLTEKEKSIKAKDKYDKRNKLMRFALGRGFESVKVYTIFKEMDI